MERRLSAARAEQAHHFAGLGVATGRFLRVDEVAVDGHFEHATFAGHENYLWDLVNFISVLPYPGMRQQMGLNID